MTLLRCLALATLIALLGASAALAADIPRLDGRVTDQTGSLDTDRVQSAIDDLNAATGIDLFVLWVRSTEDLTVTDYAQQTFAQNSLGTNDALLVVALDDRRDALWVGDDLTEISDDEIGDILSNTVEPRLADGDYTRAMVDGAQAIGQDAEAAQQPPPGQPGSDGIPAGGSAINLWPIIGIGLLFVGGFLVWRFLRDRRQQHLTAEERDRTLGQLARQANALLVETDEELRHDEQELSFAVAQFGEEEAKPFRAALASAREELKAAFTVRQKLDDDVPETPEQREAMLKEIVERCQRAKATTAEQTQHFQELRDLQRNAPQLVERLPGDLDEIEARIPGVEATLAGLGSYADSSSAPVSGNVVEARKRLAAARALVAKGKTALASNDVATAARAVKAAQDAAAQASTLLDSIDNLARALEDARGKLVAQLAEADRSVEAARSGLDGREEPEFAQHLAQAQQSLAQAHAAAEAPRPDVLAAYKLATRANAAADKVLADAQEAAERRDREQATLAAVMDAADSSYRVASDYIATRHQLPLRSAARTRLAEAQRHLDRAHALAGSDAAASLAEAQRADYLADDAYDEARSDFDDRGRPGGFGSGGGGDFLGGLIIGSIFGNRGGGWGGGGFGGGGRGFGGGFGGGGGGGGGRGAGGAW